MGQGSSLTLHPDPLATQRNHSLSQSQIYKQMLTRQLLTIPPSSLLNLISIQSLLPNFKSTFQLSQITNYKRFLLPLFISINHPQLQYVLTILNLPMFKLISYNSLTYTLIIPLLLKCLQTTLLLSYLVNLSLLISYHKRSIHLWQYLPNKFNRIVMTTIWTAECMTTSTTSLV